MTTPNNTMSAYEEALRSGSLNDIPSYITSADTMNVANQNSSFLDSAVNAVTWLPKFIGVSIISGANQLYNIPADIGNFLFDADIDRSRTNDVVSGISEDLGVFYREHRGGADLVGFMISSAVPGLGGVKVLNAGQVSLSAAITAGKFSPGMGKALGLLTPKLNKAKYMKRAMTEAMNGTSVASITSGNALRAIGSGLGQNALEALAFETATALTLFKSPVLENQDFGDFVTNVAWGAGVFGLIGGAVDGVKLKYALKNTEDAAAVAARPWTSITQPAAGSSTYEQLAIHLEDIKNIPTGPNNKFAGLSSERIQVLQEAGKAKAVTLNNKIRKQLGVITEGDEQLADLLHQVLRKGSVEEAQTMVLGLQSATALRVHSIIGKKHEILTAKVANQKATLKEVDEFMGDKLKSAYVRTFGEEAGKLIPAADWTPIITQLADTLAKGKRLTVSNVSTATGKIKSANGASKIVAGKLSYKFNLNGVIAGKPKAKVIAFNSSKAGVMETNARYIWADKLPKFEPALEHQLKIDVNDLPLMEKIYFDTLNNPESLAFVEFVGTRADELVDNNLFAFLSEKKLEIATNLLTRPVKSGAKPLVQQEIAAMVNVKSSLLAGEVRVSSTADDFVHADMFAMQDHMDKYTTGLVEQGLRHPSEGRVDLWMQPQTIKMTYDTTPFDGLDNFLIEGMLVIKSNQKLYKEATARAAAGTSVLRDFYEQFPDMTSGRVYSKAAPSGGEAGFVTSAGGNYDSLAADMTQAGNVTSRAISAAKEKVKETLTPLLYTVGNDIKAAIEWSTLNARLRGLEGTYGLNEAGTAFEPLHLIQYRKKAAAARLEVDAAVAEGRSISGIEIPKQPVLTGDQLATPIIHIQNQSVMDLARAHIEVNGIRTNDMALVRAAQGAKFNRDPAAFYPIPVNPRDFPHFAMVTDSSITSGNHSKTLYATTAEELKIMTDKLRQNPQLTVRFKKDAEEFYDSKGQWDYEKTLSDNYLDNAVKRAGVSEPYFVPTDPKKITGDMLDWHMQRETGMVREAVTAKYEAQFEELLSLGDTMNKAATSRFGTAPIEEFAEAAVKNPFAGYIRTALAIKNTKDYPWWSMPNKMADVAFSQMFRKVGRALTDLKVGDDIVEINRILKQSGYTGASYTPDMQIFANMRANKGLLTKTVQTVNSLLATTILRWDPLNAVNNAVSANVLLGAEVKAVIAAIERGDKTAVGALTTIAKIKVPGTQEFILAPRKLIATAIKKFGRKTDEFKFYEENGFITSLSRQYSDTIDDLTFKGDLGKWSQKVKERHAKMKAIGDAGERLTGNKLAEEFNRFVAADVMKQLTDIAVAAKTMTVKEQLAYINTFVNRTQGNYLAAQRPIAFQGPIGSAIGLFQTYQFNLMQQLLRHVGEGQAKDALILLGLQGTIHGMNGMPAFNAINTHIIGNASGNVEHRDAYTELYGTVGKEAGDWLMYGLASNVLGLIDPDLKINLYTRGDINPRHITILPTSLADIPAYAATTKVFGNMFNTVKSLANGAAIGTTILQGIEHNGLSRPLAGLAVTLEAMTNPQQASYSTTNQGNVVAANDWFSLISIARIAGGKPMDEAIGIDAVFRYKAYALKDAGKRTQLGEVIKSHMIAGKDPTAAMLDDFAKSYTEYGGKLDNYGSFIRGLYKKANLSQTNAIRDNLNNPFNQSMQELMGGKRIRDFTIPEQE